MIDSKKDYITEALEATHYKMEEFTPLESVFFHKKLQEKYSDGKDHRALWEHLNLDTGVFGFHKAHSWKWLDEFLQFQETYFFFDQEDDPIVYIFLESQSFVKFLDEFPINVFYLTNKNLDYLICYNDHQYLIAAGSAETWLREKVKSE